MNKNIKVLYIEDDPETRSLMADIMLYHGYKFYEADRGITGIRLAKKIIPDIIIIDLLLPDMEGYEVTTLLKSIDEVKNKPIIALTAEIRKNVKELTLAAGCDGFISKPINVNEFLHKIDEYLSGRRDQLSPEEKHTYLEKYNVQLVEKLSRKVIELEGANETLSSLNTELLKSKNDLARYNDSLFYLNNLANHLRKKNNPEEILKVLPEKTAEGFNVKRCIVFQLSDNSSELIPLYSSDPKIKELQKKKFVITPYLIENIKGKDGMIWIRNQAEIIEAGIEKFASALNSTSFILSKLNDLGTRMDSTQVMKSYAEANQHQDLPERFILFIEKDLSRDLVNTYEIRILKSFIQTVGTIYENMVLYHRILETSRIREIQAVTDELTGVYNYRYLMRELQREINRTQRFGNPFSLLMFDIDHFKNYNDVNGHLKGDALLKNIARILVENTRKTDTIARYGGEEFLIILPGLNKTKACKIAEKIHALVESEDFHNQRKQPNGNLTISLGVASFPQDGKEITTLIENVDKALYAAKRDGRNKVVVFEREKFN
jgi:diguanylate cyclase (GGDEF)-like protein